MSQENVELVRGAFEVYNAWNREAMREFYDPDAIMRPPEGWPEPGPYVGREAVMRQVWQLRETWDEDTLEPISDFIDSGDRVAVRAAWRTAGSGPEFTLETSFVYTFRNGKCVSHEFFWDHAQALEAVGLSEQDAHADS